MVRVTGRRKEVIERLMITSRRFAELWANGLPNGHYSVYRRPDMEPQSVIRGGLTRSMWWLMSLTWLGLLLQQSADVERFSGTLALVGLRCLPLFLFLWCVSRDSLRLLIWYELVLLFYFISAVEAVFAYQGDWLSVAGLVLVVLQFTFCLIYIRYRGREMRQTN